MGGECSSCCLPRFSSDCGGPGRPVVALVRSPSSSKDVGPSKAKTGFWFWGRRGLRLVKVPVEKHGFTDDVTSVVVGEKFFIALKEAGAPVAWGADRSGRLGLGCLGRLSAYLGMSTALPFPSASSSKSDQSQVIDIQLGRRHALALTRSGRVFAWGENQAGQLGLNDTKMRWQPVLIEELASLRIIQTLVVGDSSYALTDSGVVYAWGDNEAGALCLDSPSSNVLKPEAMQHVRNSFIARLECTRRDSMDLGIGESTIVAYTDSLPFVEDDKHVLGFWLWGVWRGARITTPFRPWVSATVAQLPVAKDGDGRELPPVMVPFPQAKLGGISRVVVGASYFLALCDDGHLFAWGQDSDGCLGLGDSRAVCSSAAPIVFPLDRDEETDDEEIDDVRRAVGVNQDCEERVVDIQHGRHHCLALTAAGTVYAWGENHKGQLGLGDTTTRFTPTLVEDLCTLDAHPVVQVLALRDASYARTESGLVYAWGDNREGGLALAPQPEGEPGVSVLRPSLVLSIQPKNLDMRLEAEGVTNTVARDQLQRFQVVPSSP